MHRAWSWNPDPAMDGVEDVEVECPYCGVRAETEFAYGGEGGIARPLQTETLSDEQWGD